MENFLFALTVIATHPFTIFLFVGMVIVGIIEHNEENQK